jgi:hypothetical protein
MQAYEPRFCQVCEKEIPMMYTAPGVPRLAMYSKRLYCSPQCHGVSRQGIMHHKGFFVGYFCNLDVATGDVFRLFRHVAIVDGCWLWNNIQSTVEPSWSLGGMQIRPIRFIKWLFCNENEPDLQLCHTCDNIRCINPLHTFWGTCKDNYEDSRSKHRNAECERNGRSKLTEQQILEILTSHEAGQTCRSLGDYYGVTVKHIEALCRRKYWKHL